MAKKKKDKKEKQKQTGFIETLKKKKKNIFIMDGDKKVNIGDVSEASVENITCCPIDGIIPISSSDAMKKRLKTELVMEARYNRAAFLLYENGIKMKDFVNQTLVLTLDVNDAEDLFEYNINPTIEILMKRTNLSLIFSEMGKEVKKIKKWIAADMDGEKQDSFIINIPDVVLFTGEVKSGDPSPAMRFNLQLVITKTGKNIEKIQKKNRDLAIDIAREVAGVIIDSAVKLGNSALIIPVDNKFTLKTENDPIIFYDTIEKSKDLFDQITFSSEVINQYVIFSSGLQKKIVDNKRK